MNGLNPGVRDGYEQEISSSESSDYLTDNEKQPIDQQVSVSGTAASKHHDASTQSRNFTQYLDEPPKGYSIDSEGYHTWEIPDLSELKEDKYSGPRFKVGDDFEFNLLVMPPTRKNASAYSVYLEAHPLKAPEDGNWHCCVQFAIDAWLPSDPTVHKSNSSFYRFNPRITDWGFVGLLNSRLASDIKILKSNSVNITAYVRVIDDHTGVLWHDFLEYDSKKETGYVGITNQGATCYLNSLLQSYYFTKIFRKKVYQIPTQDEISFGYNSFQQYLEQPKSVSLSLQRIFYSLQTSNKPVDTLELTHSFGWNTADAFTQHDVQELNRILMDRLESKMKNTEIEGCLNDIFVGKMKSFIRCINVDYESSRTEDFWDIQLNVKNMKNIKESFDNYVELELLNGDNKYDASGFGLQDAEKGVVFEAFPSVLHLQLKRFEYDFEYDQLVKVNDRYEYFDSLDLKPYLDKDTEAYNENWEYELQGVLVHQGDVSVGHYYAMIKPTTKDEWFRFEDDRVWRVTPHEVFEGNFGADTLTVDPRKLTREQQQEYQLKRHTSAYMLVYIRKNKIQEVLGEVTDADVPAHISKQIKFEQDEYERLRKEQEEMHLYANFKVYTNKGFLKYEGFDLGPNEEDRLNYSADLFDPESSSLKFRVLKSEPFSKVYELLAEKLGYTPDQASQFRLWTILSRHNFAYRPYVPIPRHFDDARNTEITVGQIVKHTESLTSKRKKTNQSSQLILYLEEAAKELKYLSNGFFELKSKHKVPSDLDSLEPFEDRFKKIVEIVTSEYSVPKFESVSDASDKVMLFVKYFDQKNQSVRGITHVIAPAENQIEYLTELLNNFMGFDMNTSLRFYEEFGPNQVQWLNPSKSFYKSELGNGDIICFTKAESELHPDPDVELKTVEDIYDFMANRCHFRISPLVKADEDEEEYVKIADEEDAGDSKKSLSSKSSNKEFEIWFSTMSNYKALAEKIGAQINVDPDYLRLFILGHSNQRIPLRRETVFRRLIDKIPKSQTLDLQYEVLNVTLAEFEEMKLCRVSWVGQGICREQKHEFFLPKSSTIDNLIDRLQTKVNIKPDERNDLICWAPDRHVRLSVYPLDTTIDAFDQLVIGNFPKYKEILDHGSRTSKLVTGFQFFGRITSAHGLPFVFDLVKGEPLSQTKVRLHKLLGLSDKEFNSVRVGITDLKDVEYLDSEDTDSIELFDVLNSPDIQICVDHPDRTVRKGAVFEPSIFIRE
ncbi:hypothetical protein OGAPHI_000363 [Ogataea philodendri]|uniref:ubiquitinyl hydrolase 1 n=1 Tax=Ogataea philodendri TaxID=1378263 RepID=A0A9P8T9S5_9ASCO|nr:uncharacterized protein OGAPHI_000363 [Ogataea philodendri]KAH3671658.1 hypothetical protein OGAPHI_000363 [Ogataea philodendri]